MMFLKNYLTTLCFNNSKSLAVVSDLDSEAYACQTINVKKEDSTRQTFTLSGWAKGEGIIDREREACEKPSFCLRACINYKSGECEEHIAEFSPCTDGWQFASVEFAKEKFCAVESIKVYCDYSNNVGTAYFDNIQLVCNSIETELFADDFTTISEDYSADEDTAEDTFNPGFSTEAEETDSAPEFEEARDPHGNPFTETNFVDGEFGTIYRSFKYYNDMDHIGNDLTCETDPRGNETKYDVNTNTSKNNAVIDRCGNKTEYEYDRFGEVSKVTSFEKIGEDDEGNPIYHPLADVSYAYCEFGQLGMISRGDGMKYNIDYDEFNQLQAIGIKGKPEKLVKYDYKTGSGRLKSVTYANGNVMYATYNSIGQMISETWKDTEDGNIIAYYKYVYDGSGNIVRSLDIVSGIEYTYTYEEGRIVRATETVVIYDSNCIAVSRGDTNTIFYSYNNEGQLVKKRVVTSDGAERITYYEHNDDNTIVKFSAGGLNATAHSKTDGFGRKIFDEVQTGRGFVSRQFSYHAGAVTDAHKDSDKVKSSPTTQLVSRIELSDGRSLSYEYDAEERITSVVESYAVDGQPVTNTILYTYDALGQLLTETVNGVVVNEMTYDNYGNILTKNGKIYTYGDSVWKDKLTAIDGQAITYDAQGNPVSYLGHDLTWEKGRQLKYFDGVSYTYNANAIRTSKTVNGAKHTYILDGTKILREHWMECATPHTITPLYDNEDSVCGIDYGNHTFYFLKNLQGDVIAIADIEGNVVGRYSYDAWGVPTITQDSSFTVWEKGVELYSFNIAEVNPFRYRGYYYDNEIGLYYLQSRYYNPVTGRFVNADIPEIIVLHGRYSLNVNMYAYCNNDPVIGNDPMGMLDAAGAASWLNATDVFNMYAQDLYTAYAATLTKIGLYITAFLTPKVSAAFWWQPWLIAGIVVAAVAIVIASVAIIYNAKVKERERERQKYLTSDKTLSDVKLKLQSGKHYHLAYISKQGELYKTGNKMTFVQALIALGITGAVNSITRRYKYDKTKSSTAQRTLEHKGNRQWGIYADTQSAAKALAVVLGSSEKPKVHGSGYYGHYHDFTHTFHIWYGGKIIYK